VRTAVPIDREPVVLKEVHAQKDLVRQATLAEIAADKFTFVMGRRANANPA